MQVPLPVPPPADPVVLHVLPPVPPVPPVLQAKMTPKAFIHNIHEICRADLQHIVLPEVSAVGLMGWSAALLGRQAVHPRLASESLLCVRLMHLVHALALSNSNATSRQVVFDSTPHAWGCRCMQSADRRVLAAASEVVKKGLARVTLLGKPAEVAAAAEKFRVDISGCSVLDFLVGGWYCCLLGARCPGGWVGGTADGTVGCTAGGTADAGAGLLPPLQSPLWGWQILPLPRVVVHCLHSPTPRLPLPHGATRRTAPR